jgi:hypothetical protein
LSGLSYTLTASSALSLWQDPLTLALGAIEYASDVAFSVLEDPLTAALGAPLQQAIVNYDVTSPDPLTVELGTVDARIVYTHDVPGFTVTVAIGSVGMVANTAYGVTSPSALATAQGAASPSAANVLTIDPDRRTYWGANGGDAALYTGWGGGTWGGVDAGVAQATVQVGTRAVQTCGVHERRLRQLAGLGPGR